MIKSEKGDILKSDTEALVNTVNCVGVMGRGIASLIQGFETPYGMELISSVHWVATREGARNAQEATAKIYAWNERKKMFPAEHIQVALDVLSQKGWLH